MAAKTYHINFMGDTMLGRLIDQLMPTSVHEPEEARIVDSFRNSNPELMNYNATTLWGNTLPLLHSADLNILNLETSATTHAAKWPDKVFNYRMHPANIVALQAAKINYAGLANNHTLDFCEPGLLETVRTIRGAGIAFAGAGESKDDATRPAILRLPTSKGDNDHEIHIWAASDHPRDWSSVQTFHSIDYTPQTRDRLKALLNKPTPDSRHPALKIFSVHWGPNYSWQPSKEIQQLAHFLIDECGIDIIHGHSSHHVQGMEKYNGKLIIWGCGDFLDDYALVRDWRNDLSAIWTVGIEEGADFQGSTKLKPKIVEIHPTIIKKFKVQRLGATEADSIWVRNKIKDLSADFGSEVELEEGGEGRAIFRLD